jgi:hypothetical protein
MESVIIFGGDNTLGQIIARHLLTSGMHVTVFSEAQNTHKISHHHYKYIRGDVYNIHSVSQALSGQDAVISVYSSSYLWKLFYLRDALQNMMQGMEERRVDRFIYFSYSDEDFPASDGHIHNPFFKKIFGIDYNRKIKAMFEESIRKSSLNFTIDSLDLSFLRQSPRPVTLERLKQYYFRIADETQKQLMLKNTWYSHVRLTYEGQLLPA